MSSSDINSKVYEAVMNYNNSASVIMSKLYDSKESSTTSVLSELCTLTSAYNLSLTALRGSIGKEDNKNAKKATNLFQTFQKKEIGIIKQENPSMPFGEVSKEVAKRWRAFKEEAGTPTKSAAKKISTPAKKKADSTSHVDFEDEDVKSAAAFPDSDGDEEKFTKKKQSLVSYDDDESTHSEDEEEEKPQKKRRPENKIESTADKKHKTPKKSN